MARRAVFGLTNSRTQESFRLAGRAGKPGRRHLAPFGVVGEGGQTEPRLRCGAILPDGTPGGTSRQEADSGRAGSKLRARWDWNSTLGCCPGCEPAVARDGRAVVPVGDGGWMAAGQHHQHGAARAALLNQPRLPPSTDAHTGRLAVARGKSDPRLACSGINSNNNSNNIGRNA